ncbi:hypothetical protein B0T24DRAFT_661196 [Lasiosphaeria ovina]|uniref:NACHT domain-containing protein n=1 Tax=Lasiosphaeria ovina TaxID=92902 RepID=A0AAE0TWW2_9PEZI|nr:hypothetical protein B0T24DRAFT_661196 [Lasiosphaeria ovina]
MDELTPLGVASNVVQLRSATGTSDNVVVLNDVASALGRLTDAVVIAPECSEDLKELSLAAKRTAQQLLDVLEALRVKTKKTRWKSFLVAAKEVYKADQIESLTTNLSRLQMQILLHLQSQVGKLVLAKFYFWNSGTRLQKSQEGLLQSLLFEILRQCPELGHHFWAKSQTFLDTEVLLSTLVSKSFCFIIDGLDEYQADDTHDHRDLIKTLRELSAWPGIKFCVSSRPWTVFVDAFGGAPDQVLKLEDLTREDVRRYGSDKFNEHDQYRELSQFDPSYSQLVDEVVRRAQGGTMRRRLDSFPETLEAFFQHILSSVPKFYRIQTARAFQVAYPLPMVMYSFLNDIEDDLEIVDRESRRPCGGPEVKQRRDTMRRRFDAWCKGLLEVGTFGQRNGYGSFQNDRVDFLHRTVRDFLVSENVQGITNLPSEERRQTWIGLCQAVLLQFKRAPENTFPPTTDYLDELCHFARNAICDGAPIGLIHEILEKVIDVANAVESLALTSMRDGQPLRPSQLTEIFRQAVKPGPISRKVYADSVASIIKYGESSDYDMEQAFFSVFEEVVRKIRAYMSTKRDGVVELVKLMASYGYPIEKDRVERHFPRHVIELMILQVWPSQAEAPAGRARVPAREQTRPMALRYAWRSWSDYLRNRVTYLVDGIGIRAD